MISRPAGAIALIALLCAALAACSFNIGVPINRSLSGWLSAADVAPREKAYFVMNLADGDAQKIKPITYANPIPLVGFKVQREGADFRISPGPGFLTMPQAVMSDTRTLYAIPGERSRYFFEYNAVDDDGARQLRAVFVERRCEGDTCVLAMADDMPINSEASDSSAAVAPVDPNCSGSSCTWDTASLVGAAPQISAKITVADLNKYFLIYQDAQQ